MTSTVTATPDEAVDISTPGAPGTRPPRRAIHLAGVAAAAALAIFGIAAVAKGIDGRSTVRDALAQERVVGSSHMTPQAIAAKAAEAGLRDVSLPRCSVAGKPIVDGAGARCFAEYMRIDALMGTRGATYAQMPRFATGDGKGTNDPADAQKGADGQPLGNPARNVWVTQTALATALNTSYMAEQISLFGNRRRCGVSPDRPRMRTRRHRAPAPTRRGGTRDVETPPATGRTANRPPPATGRVWCHGALRS